MRFKSIWMTALIALAAWGLSSCTSQAKRTYKVFEQPEATHDRLIEAMEALKYGSYDASVEEQFKAAKFLRYLSLFAPDQGKREMAIEALAVLNAFMTDGDAQDLVASRLDALIDSEDPLAKLAVIQAQTKIALGLAGMTEKITSLTDNKIDYEYHQPDGDARLEAVEFLVDHFEDQPLEIQVRMTEAFTEILANQARCFEYEKENPENCVKSDLAEIQDYKVELIDAIGDWIEMEELDQQVLAQLLLAVEGARAIKKEGLVIDTLLKWSEEADLNEAARLMAGALYRKKIGDHTDIFTDGYKEKVVAMRKGYKRIDWSVIKSDAEVTAIADRLEEAKDEKEGLQRKLNASSFVNRPDYAKPELSLDPAFWMNNAEPILTYQLFKADAEPKEVPRGWVFNPVYESGKEATAMRGILLHYVKSALKSGYVIDGKEELTARLAQSLQFEETTSLFEKSLTLELVGLSYQSLKARGEEVAALLDLLETSISETGEPFLKRQYLMAMAGALETSRAVVEPRICKLMDGLDIMTRWRLLERVRALGTDVNPYLEAEPEEWPTIESPAFCGQPLFVPQPRFVDVTTIIPKPVEMTRIVGPTEDVAEDAEAEADGEKVEAADAPQEGQEANEQAGGEPAESGSTNAADGAETDEKSQVEP